MDYTIKSGDTLSSIAAANNTDVATLASLNNIANPDLIYAGTTIKLPGQTSTSTTAPITSSTLQPQPTINIPTAPTPTPTPAPTYNVADEYLNSLALTTNEQNALTGQENIVGKMLENLAALQGESAYKSELTAGSNLNTLKTDLQNLNSQILKKQAEINQDDITLVSNMRAEENRDTLLPFAQAGQAKLAGDAQIVRALKTSEIGVLNAQAIGKQGDIALAIQTINDAVDAKYAPYRAQNELYKAQLEAIQPYLTSAEKKLAQAQEFKLKQATKEIDKVSDFQKEVLKIAISNKAPSTVLSEIMKATSIEEILKVSKGYENIFSGGSSGSGVDYNSYSEQISSYDSKQSALDDLELNKEAIINDIGEEGYNNLLKDIDNYFGGNTVSSSNTSNFFNNIDSKGLINAGLNTLGATNPVAGVVSTVDNIYDFLFN